MKDFFQKLFGFSIGPIVGAIIGFITVPITSHLISPEQYGLASMFNLANSILTLIVLFGLDQAFMREYNESEDKNKLLFNSILIPFIGTIVVAFALIIFRGFVANLLFGNSFYVQPVFLLAVCLPLFIIEKFLLLSIRMEEKAFKYSLWNILSKLFNLIWLIILLLLYKRTFESVIYATIISQFMVSVILCYVCRKNLKFSKNSIDKKQIKKILKFGLPLIPATLIGYGLNSMDAISLRVITSYTELGYYSVALKIVTLLTLVQTSFTNFWSPMAFKWKSENVSNKKYEKVSKGITFVMSLILILILLIKDLIPVLVSKEYIQVVYILPFLLFHPIFYTMSETTTLGIAFSRKTGYNIIVSTVSLLVNLFLNIILIPEYGAVGAAVATGISYLCFFWTRTIISRRLWYKMPIKHFVYTCIILTVATFTNTFVPNIFITTTINLLGLLGIMVVYKDIILEIKKTFKKRKNNQKIVGLVCFDTQKTQLKDMIESDQFKVVDLNFNQKNKLKKLLFLMNNIRKVDIIYFGYGCYKMNPYLKIAKLYNKKVITHWIGSDVLKIKNNKNIDKVQSYISYNLTCSPVLKDELSDIGITVEEVAIIPTNMSGDYSKLPKKHGVMMYLPKGSEDFYGIKYLEYAAKQFKSIQFYVVGNDNDTLHLKNVCFLGKIPTEEMNDLYDKTSILIRLPEHDGLSLMLLESLIKGKEVIYCYDFPHTRHVTNINELKRELDDIISKKPKHNVEGHDYVLEKYNLNDIKLKLQNILLSLMK